MNTVLIRLYLSVPIFLLTFTYRRIFSYFDPEGYIVDQKVILIIIYQFEITPVVFRFICTIRCYWTSTISSLLEEAQRDR